MLAQPSESTLDNPPFGKPTKVFSPLFPPACPDLNPQEHVWSQVHTAVSHNHTFTVFAQLKTAFLSYLSNTVFRFDWLTKYAPPILCQP
ncbi:MAG: hypothetical protein K8L97_17230 [Anaerolineae bacterium]|nr:hypothetical protein [Anaerolineae bacterium]